MKRIIPATIIMLLAVTQLQAQMVAYSDPAQAYNKLLIDKNDGSSYSRIGTFKVIGSSYLFGEKQTGSVYTKDGTALHIPVSYNTYTQQLEAYTAGQDKPILKDIDAVDSFRLEPTKISDYTKEMFFVNALHAGATEKAFFQVVYEGSKYNLYKKYKSVLGYVSTNYIQSELREFDLEYEYYYSDKTTKQVKKLKASASSVRKEFKGVKDLTGVADETSFGANPENALLKVFIVLNQ